jgi:hypothetical protein
MPAASGWSRHSGKASWLILGTQYGNGNDDNGNDDNGNDDNGNDDNGNDDNGNDDNGNDDNGNGDNGNDDNGKVIQDGGYVKRARRALRVWPAAPARV